MYRSNKMYIWMYMTIPTIVIAPNNSGPTLVFIFIRLDCMDPIVPLKHQGQLLRK